MTLPEDQTTDLKTKYDTNTTDPNKGTIIGQYIIGPDGSVWSVQDVSPGEAAVSVFGNAPMYVGGAGIQLFNQDTGEQMDFQGGPVITAAGEVVQARADGTYDTRATRHLAQTELANYLAYGTLTDPTETAGGSGTVVGSRAPDPVGAADILLAAYKAQVANDAIPHQNALDELQRKINILGLVQDNQIANQNAVISQGQLQGSYDTLAERSAADQEDALRAREIARTNRGLGIEQERTARQADISRLLPSAIPNLSGLRLPFFQGQTLPINQIQPDQYAGLANLNAIPDISQSLGVQFPTAQRPPNVPMLNPVDETQFPTLPGAPQTGIPMDILQNLAAAAAAGSSGWRV